MAFARKAGWPETARSGVTFPEGDTRTRTTTVAGTRSAAATSGKRGLTFVVPVIVSRSTLSFPRTSLPLLSWAIPTAEQTQLTDTPLELHSPVSRDSAAVAPSILQIRDMFMFKSGNPIDRGA